MLMSLKTILMIGISFLSTKKRWRGQQFWRGRTVKEEKKQMHNNFCFYAKVNAHKDNIA